MSPFQSQQVAGCLVSKLIECQTPCDRLSSPPDAPQGCFQLAEIIWLHSLENLSLARIFSSEETEQTPEHTSCLFSCTILRHPLPPIPAMQSLLSKHTNKKESPPFPFAKKGKHTDFAWAAPLLLNTQLCQHLFPLPVVKMHMLSSFLSRVLSLAYCETCYLVLGKIKSLQTPQGTKPLVFLDSPSSTLLLESMLDSLSWKDKDANMQIKKILLTLLI